LKSWAAGAQTEVRVNFVSPEYFPLLRIRLRRAAVGSHGNYAGARFAVINQTMARQYWPNGDAINHQIRIPC